MKRFLAAAFAALFTTAVMLPAQEDSTVTDPLETLRFRLQEQRATALRSRLVIYTDEVQKLRTAWAAANDDSRVRAADTELAEIQKALRILSTPAIERLDDEKAEDSENKRAPSVVLARRVDGVVKRFDEATREAPLASTPGAGRSRVRFLKIEDARKAESSGTYEDGRDYWIYDGSAASWTLTDLQPGLYDVEVRYSCGENGGSAVMNLKAAGQKLAITVPKGENSKRRLTISPGQLRVTDPGLDVRIEGVSRGESSKYYWDLHEIILRPAAAKPKTP
jgi:hypothetical protein